MRKSTWTVTNWTVLYVTLNIIKIGVFNWRTNKLPWFEKPRNGANDLRSQFRNFFNFSSSHSSISDCANGEIRAPMWGCWGPFKSESHKSVFPSHFFPNVFYLICFWVQNNFFFRDNAKCTNYLRLPSTKLIEWMRYNMQCNEINANN